MPEKQPEVWTYCGIRVGQKGKKIHAWQDPAGEMLYFGKLSAVGIGGQYEVQVDRAADGSFASVSVGAKYTGRKHADADLIAQWQTESRLAEASLARDRAERKLRTEPDAFEQALAPLRDLRAASCRTRADRTAFTAMVLDALGR
jgi:hypothetical protein